MRSASIIALPALSVACRAENNGSEPTPEPASTQAPAAKGEVTPTVEALMADHFTQATALREAVVDGKLTEGKAAAAALAGLPSATT
jgi:hypothetical protein